MRPGVNSTNETKAKLKAGGSAIGTWVVHDRNPSIVRILAGAGFDFVFIDAEHSDFSLETIGSMCELARASGIAPIVRPWDRAPGLANRIQDIGAMGLMYRDITTRQQVDDLLHAMFYPPRGDRGAASATGAQIDYIWDGTGAEMRRFVDEQTMLIIQIESREGVERIDEILGGGGVDVVEIGRHDLSTSLGVPLEVRHPTVLEAVDAVIASCDRHGVTPGINCVSLEDAADMTRRGIRCVSYSSDRSVIVKAYRDVLADLTEIVEGQR